MEAIAFVGPYLFATKPAIRALLKAANLCAKEPEAGARVLEHRAFEPRYDVIVKVLEEVIYWNWRDAHPEDALHFLGLRLHEAGMISTTHARQVDRTRYRLAFSERVEEGVEGVTPAAHEVRVIP